jgi:hypothetical protein
MSYQLRQRQTLGDNLRRICRKQIEGAIAIAKGEKESRDTPVHETQTLEENPRGAAPRTKGNRARLVPRTGSLPARRSAVISDVRDAEVRLQTVRQFDRISKRRRQEGYGNLEQMFK